MQACILPLTVYDSAYMRKMRSAQTPFGARAIMKKFIYVCNDYTTFRLAFYVFIVLAKCE